MLDFRLSPEQIAIRDKAREFAMKEVLPRAWYSDAANTLPMTLLDRARELGLMNEDVPEAYGGRGAGLVEAAIVTEEISAACSGIATSVFDNSLGMEPVLLSGNEEAKTTYIPKIIHENKLICFATSEPMMGSDVAGMRCLATPDGDDFILNGTKTWITNGGVADYMTIFATTDPKARHDGICCFLVEAEWEGVRVGNHIPKMGQRGSNTTAIHLKDVRVPKKNVLAMPGDGFVLAMKTFSRTRPLIGAFGIGAARSAMECAIDYAKKRRAFGMKLADFQAIQFKIAEMYQKVETARLLVLKAAWEADQGMDPTISASIGKFYATEAAFEVASEAVQICGGYGFTRLFPVEKIFRDVRLLMIYEGTSEIQRLIVSGHALNEYTPVLPPIEDIPMITPDPGETDFDVEMEGQSAWKCKVCGYIHKGDAPPDECPVCFFPGSAFKKVWPAEETD